MQKYLTGFLIVFVTVLCVVWYTCSTNRLMNDNRAASEQVIQTYGLEKRIVKHYENHLDFEKQHYTVQNNWLNVWLLLLGLGVTGISIWNRWSYSQKLEELNRASKETLDNQKRDFDNHIKDLEAETEKFKEKLQGRYQALKQGLEQEYNAMKQGMKKAEKQSDERLEIDREISNRLQFIDRLPKELEMLLVTDRVLKYIDDQSISLNDKNRLKSRVYRTKYFWYSNQEKYFEKALDAINQSIELNPGYIFGYANKSFILSKLNRYEEAVDLLESVLEKPEAKSADPNMEPWTSIRYNLAEAYIYTNRFKDAIDMLKLFDINGVPQSALNVDMENWTNILKAVGPKNPQKKYAGEILEIIKHVKTDGK
ncbi:MAG: hypothetical protein FWG18_02085 [Alphaproteobacteria bacterium]|nr:hypothetical protein [Alphaproteobacteria bacterium]